MASYKSIPHRDVLVPHGIFGARTLEPYFLNPKQWNLKGYTGFVWGGTALLTLVWAYFRLTETNGRMFGEIDMLLRKRLVRGNLRSIRQSCMMSLRLWWRRLNLEG